MRRLFRNFAIWLAAVGIGGVAVHGAAVAAEKRVALLMGPTQDPYIGGWARAFIAVSAPALKVTVLESPRDAAVQAQQIDDAIAQRFDLIVVQTLSQKAIVPPLIRAKAASIPVMLVIAQLSAPGAENLYTSYVGNNAVEQGQLAGGAMGDILMQAGRKDARVAVVAGAMAEGIAPARAEGFKAAMAKYSNIRVVALEEAMWNPALAEKAAGQLLARFNAHGGLDGIYAMNDSMANGVIQAAEAAGVKFGAEKGSLVVIGGNCQAPGVKNLAAGKEMATLFTVPAEEGKKAATVAKVLLDGKKVEKNNFMPLAIMTKSDLPKWGEACAY